MSTHHTGPVDIYLPHRDVPYYSTVCREEEAGWGTSGGYLYGHGGGSYDGQPIWTFEEAVDIARRQFPKASVLIFKTAGTQASGFKDIVVRRVELGQE